MQQKSIIRTATNWISTAKMVGEHIMTHDGGNNNSDDTSYARFGVKGETQISTELTGYGQFEYNIKADKPEGQQGSATRLAFAGLKFSDYGSFDYGRNYGVVYDAAGYTDMLVEWGGVVTVWFTPITS
ncbi:outer membrane protein F [Klebsiella michiganensis]|uniref:Outer membrane protein F n=1 Tax=Klebsiella michiganensis TaxID=1134687 RepID=A0A7H4MVZ8_9ENTR|nr:outer membrane protein F [Klebsiella michiganensis]